MTRPDDPAARLKGRGTAANIPHRFSSEIREAVDDGWQSEDTASPSPRTQLLVDAAKSMISWNESPDVDFDRSLNPYRGCEHGCVYCYARPTHAYLGLSPGLDFETQIFHKPDAPALLRAELAKPGYRCAPIALGAATDAYQPVERQTGTTRRLLEVLRDCAHPVSIVTKNALIRRDIDLLRDMARDGLVEAAISLTTLNPELARQLEPRASSPAARLQAMAALAEAGIPVRIFTSPLIPGLTDQELEKLLAAGREHGATRARYILLRLPHEVAELFNRWLAAHAPEKAARVMSVLYDLRQGKANDARFGSRMRGVGHFAELFRQRFALACRRLDLAEGPPPLDCSRFTAPPPPAGAKPQQLDLF